MYVCTGMYQVCTGNVTCKFDIDLDAVFAFLHHCLHVQHTEYHNPWSKVTKEYPQNVFGNPCTYRYVPVCTWYIHVCTICMTCTFFRGCTCVEMLGYHNIHVPHAQYSIPQSKVKNMSALQTFGETLYRPVCTSMYQ